MGIRRFEDLVAWQLAHQLQEEIFAFTAHPPASRDAKYCDQIRDSSRSATRNTAEGFGRYYPKEFRRFLRIASGSLHETKNHLHDGKDRNYFTAADHERLVRLNLRAIKANVRLQGYLERAKAPVPFSTEVDGAGGNAPTHRELSTQPAAPPNLEPIEPGEPSEPT